MQQTMQRIVSAGSLQERAAAVTTHQLLVGGVTTLHSTARRNTQHNAARQSQLAVVGGIAASQLTQLCHSCCDPACRPLHQKASLPAVQTTF